MFGLIYSLGNDGQRKDIARAEMGGPMVANDGDTHKPSCREGFAVGFAGSEASRWASRGQVGFAGSVLVFGFQQKKGIHGP